MEEKIAQHSEAEGIQYEMLRDRLADIKKLVEKSYEEREEAENIAMSDVRNLQQSIKSDVNLLEQSW